jgi:hypothetical protein
MPAHNSNKIHVKEKNVRSASLEILVITTTLFVILLTIINIENCLTPNKVLGAETSSDSDQQFWTDFLTKNPEYIPGWYEVGRIDKAREIDPNYELGTSN